MTVRSMLGQDYIAAEKKSVCDNVDYCTLGLLASVVLKDAIVRGQTVQTNNHCDAKGRSETVLNADQSISHSGRGL